MTYQKIVQYDYLGNRHEYNVRRPYHKPYSRLEQKLEFKWELKQSKLEMIANGRTNDTNKCKVTNK